MKRLHFRPQLRAGSLELNRFQELMFKNVRELTEPLIDSYGLFITKDFNGNKSNDWLVEAVNNRTIKVNKGKAFIKDVNNEIAFIKLEEDYAIEMPLTDGIYKISLRHKYTNNEKGKVTVYNNTNTVYGTDTEFTKVFALNRRIYLNGEAYIVTDVISDTELVLASNYTGLDLINAQYQVGGYFSEYPYETENNYIYEHDGFEIIVTTQSLQTNDIYLADVTITNGWVVNIVDKRSQFYIPYQEYPQLNETHIRNRKEVIYRPVSLCDTTVNAETQGIKAQINADDSHGTSFSSKFAIRFYKGADDTTINLTYTPQYTNGGSLTDIDKTKWKVRLSIPNILNTNDFYLSTTTLTLDISSLNEGYYELHFQLAKVTTAYNLSIFIEEVYLTGGRNFIV